MLAPGRGDQAGEQQGGGEEAGDGEHRHQRTNMALIASQQYRQQATPLSFVLSILVVRLGYMAANIVWSRKLVAFLHSTLLLPPIYILTNTYLALFKHYYGE